MTTIKDKIRTVGEVFNDNRETYNQFVKEITKLSGKQFRPVASDPWYTVKDKLKQLQESEKRTLQVSTAKIFKNGIIDIDAKDSLNNGNELVIPTSISDAKQHEALDHHTTRIKQISDQIDEKIATLDEHIQICNMRLAELKKLKVGYAAFKSSTSARKRLPKKAAKKPVVKSKKLASSTAALNKAFGRTS